MKQKTALQIAVSLALTLGYAPSAHAQVVKKTDLEGQGAGILRLGDPAPAIKYSKWLKGEPTTSFNGDQLYILEFWATWCGPCKAAMPHLSELQKKYAGKATVIGVNVWERIRDGQLYESSLPMVQKFVESNDANMGFSVMVDNNDQDMSTRWLKAAGRNGIPATFIVKNERIIWVGHPGELDALLPKVLDGSYDMAAVKAKADKQANEQANQQSRTDALSKPLQEALAAKQYGKVVELSKDLGEQHPDLLGYFISWKRRALIAQRHTNLQKLRIGDPAPVLKGAKWLKGDPIASFRTNHVYVLGFWSTWSPASIKAMPHWTKLQEQYAGKATVIGVNVSEKKAPYGSPLAKRARFVQLNSANMGFSVLADSDEEHMRKSWQETTFNDDLPAMFVVKDGNIVWAGNPRELDAVLPAILDGSFDMKGFKARFDEYADKMQDGFVGDAIQHEPAKLALAAKEYKKAVVLAEEWMGFEAMSSAELPKVKFEALLQLSEKDALAFANEALTPSAVFYLVTKNDKLLKSTYLWAAKNFEDYYSKGGKLNAFVFSDLAACYAKGGDYQKAVELQGRAIVEAKAELAKAEMPGVVVVQFYGMLMGDDIADFEAALAEYRKASKKAKRRLSKAGPQEAAEKQMLALNVEVSHSEPVNFVAKIVADPNPKPGTIVTLALRAAIAEGWHVYATSPPNSHYPAVSFNVELPPGASFVNEEWTLPKHEPLVGYEDMTVYRGDVVFLRRVRLPDQFSGPLSFPVSVSWQACDPIMCMPPATKSLVATLAAR